MGKGSTPRPLSVDGEKFRELWDNIFQSKEELLDELAAISEELGDYETPETPT